MSDAPKVDAWVNSTDLIDAIAYNELADFARQLERENAALKADAERYRQHLKGYWWDNEIETSFAAYELEQREVDDKWWKEDDAEIDAAINAEREREFKNSLGQALQGAADFIKAKEEGK
jgi:hypothetical protein